MAMIAAGQDVLILKLASASRSSGHWSDDDFDVLCNGAVVGRIFNANAAPVGLPWMWTLIFPHLRGRPPTHGYAATQEAAMAAASLFISVKSFVQKGMIDTRILCK
jgi:hypothetical protein